jgi:hypothetical protein
MARSQAERQQMHGNESLLTDVLKKRMGRWFRGR